MPACLTVDANPPPLIPLLCWSSTDLLPPEEEQEREVAGPVAGGPGGEGDGGERPGVAEPGLYPRVHSVNIQTTGQVLRWGEAKFCEEERV